MANAMSRLAEGNLARRRAQMTHYPQQEFDNPIGNAISEWGRGVKQRTLHPLEALAGEVQRYQDMPIDELATSFGPSGGGMGGIVGMFAGKGAKTANLDLLRKAEELKAAGVPDEQIWGETGWTMGFPDNQPRFEIPDDLATAQFTHLPPSTERLSEKAILHPSLYGEYPSLSDVGQLGLKEGRSGSFSPEMQLMTAKAPNEQELKSVGLHELQHAIQQREGFARGGSPDSMSGVVPPKQQKMLDELELMGDPIDASGMPLSFKPRHQLTKEEKAIKDRYTYLTHQTQLNANDNIGAYRALAGEAEARLTQARMNMTPEQRAVSYPPSMFDVQADQQIVRYGDGNRLSQMAGGDVKSVPAYKFSRVVDTFGDGNNVKMYDDTTGKYVHKQVMPSGKVEWQIGEMGMMDGKHTSFLDQPIGKKGYGSGGKQTFDNKEDAISSIRGAKLSESATARNAKYGAIPSTWSGESKQLAKKLIDEYGDVKFGSSTQSKSKYVTLPSGEKIRMADHTLPNSYDSADFDFRYGGDTKQFLQSVRDRLSPQPENRLSQIAGGR